MQTSLKNTMEKTERERERVETREVMTVMLRFKCFPEMLTRNQIMKKKNSRSTGHSENSFKYTTCISPHEYNLGNTKY